jgi:hypothetical protein
VRDSGSLLSSGMSKVVAGMAETLAGGALDVDGGVAQGRARPITRTVTRAKAVVTHPFALQPKHPS